MTASRGSLDRDFFQATASGALVALGLSVPVPVKQNWKIWGVTVLVTTTATVGDRLITIELLDSADAVLAVVVAGQNVTASETQSVNFALGGYATAKAGSTPLASVWDAWPILVALAGQRLRITDQTGVDVADTAKVLVSGEWERTG